MKLEPNTTVSHYRILSAIGKGGMGEVYLAQDTKLDRKAAIKFLSKEFGKDEDKLNRFILEAQATSALNHPNILTVYGIDNFEDTHYLATEFIEGETLRAVVSEKGSIQMSRVLKIAIQVAEALSAAHHAGIAHRDIKPENIMVRKDGYVKVLDFGLAKLMEKQTSDNEITLEGETKPLVKTSPGVVMGTVSYMSPEQARGQETDERTDIWSLGVVLYEMLSGKIPFEGETINHTIVSILETEPKLLNNVPDELQRIVRKSLSKDRDMRYQNTSDLVIDLKNLRRDLDIKGELERSIVPNRDAETGSSDLTRSQPPATGEAVNASTQNLASTSSLEYAVTLAKSHKLATGMIAVLLVGVIAAISYFAFFSGRSGQIESIAVMPFVNESGNADVEYLSDGMTETLISSLSQLPNLNVKGRSSVFRYKGKDVDTKTLTRELGVQAVLYGRVVQRGDQLSLSLELLDALTENVIWSGKYTRKLDGILGLQNEIAKEVAGQLEQKLAGEENLDAGSKSTENPEAYLLYLKGRYYTGRFTQEGLDTGLRFFNESIAKDPAYANAYAGLAYSYISAADWFLPSNEALPKAKEAARKALALDSNHAAAQEFLAIANWWYDWDVKAADAGFRRSLKLDPDDPHAVSFYGFFLATTGRFDEGIAEGKRAIKIDPLSPDSNSLLGQSYYFARRYDEAEEQVRKTIAIDPEYWFAHSVLARVLTKKGRLREALEEAKKAQEIEGGITEIRAVLAHVLAASGNKDEARKELESVKTLKVVPQFNLAETYSALGEKDLAFKALEQAVKDRSFFVTFLAREPFLDPLREDPRFDGLIERTGLGD